MFVRVILDTCAVRNHTDNCQPQIDLNLVQKNRNAVRLSLSASAFVELARQLKDGDLPFTTWQARIPSLNAALDPRWPSVPNGKELAWLARTQIVEPIENIENESCHMQARWHHLLNVAPEKMGKCQVVYRMPDGTASSIRLDVEALTKTVAEQRQEWIDYIQKMQSLLPAIGVGGNDEEKILKLMKSNFGSDPGDAPDVAAKLDAVSRMIARFVAMGLHPSASAYNPESEKRRGDAFDINLLFYVPLPAVVVTGDARFVRGLRQTKSRHARQVLTIEEFNDHLSGGTLTSLVSDFQTPDRQYRQHCEAAYFRWQRRGGPLGDELADWFASEPIA